MFDIYGNKLCYNDFLKYKAEDTTLSAYSDYIIEWQG